MICDLSCTADHLKDTTVDTHLANLWNMINFKLFTILNNKLFRIIKNISIS